MQDTTTAKQSETSADIRHRVWLDLSDALIERDRLGMTPEIDGTRNPHQVAATLASFAGEIQLAGGRADTERYYNLLIEAAAECVAAASAHRRAAAAADRDGGGSGDNTVLKSRARERRDQHRREIDSQAATRAFSASPAGDVPPARSANAVRVSA